ncbi:MAG TPA: hypothetical protein VM008_03235 [Phycisphaerae bacterium]|nr:hypothetical protein [Phycisphaerae bacterium]
MADFQRVVEFLRDLRQGPLQEVTEEIRQSATDYAALCVSANERLRKCSTFLSQGLRTEAIHLADETPNLLDLVAALDLPDPLAWQDFCQNNGLPVPPPLQLDRASQLNDAYAQDQPLEHLLAQHRLLALARGPVRQRLALLRQIAGQDVGNTTWERDIRAFEKARLKELPTAFYNAVKNRDEVGMSGLMQEITQTQWLEPVPGDLVTAVSDAFNRMQRASAEVELRKLVEPLREAYAARSFQECQAIVQRWKNIMDGAGVTIISTELTDEIRPVVQFVQEQEKREELLRKFRESCRKFAQMMDMDVPDTQLEAGYAKLKGFNEPIPEELTARYQEKLAYRQRAAERKHRGRLIGIGVAVAGVAAVAVVVVVLMTRASEAKQWADKIEQAINARSEGNLRNGEQLVEYLKANHPSYLSEPAVAAAVRHVSKMQTEFDHDSGAVQSLLAALGDALKSGAAVAANDKATLEQLASAAAALQEALTQANGAGELSWVDQDKKLAAAENQANGVLSNLQDRASAGVQAEVGQLGEQVDAIPVVPANLNDADTQLVTASGRARALRDLVGINEQAKGAAAGLADKIEERRKALNATRAMAGELADIRENSGTADDLKKALAAFAQKYPNDARTADFNVVIPRLALAKDVEAWHDMAASWSGQLAATTSDAAQRRGEEIASYLTARPSSPMSATANSYSDYLKHAADALAEKGIWQTDLSDFFNNPLLTSIAYMQTSDGQRFYVEGEINRKDRRINDQVTVTFEAVDPLDQTKRMLVSVDPPTKLVTDTPVPLPHTKVIGALNDQLKGIDATNWETWGIDAVDSLLKNKELNIVIKATVVEKILRTEIAIAGWNGSNIGENYAVTLTELARQKPGDLPWADLSKNSEVTIQALQKTLGSIPSAASVREKLAMAKSALFKQAAFDIIGTGVLLKDEAGHWAVASRGKGGDGQLWTAIPAPGAAEAAAPIDPAATDQAAPAAPPGSLVLLGTVQNGKFALYETAVRGLPQGTMVYITSNDAGK